MRYCSTPCKNQPITFGNEDNDGSATNINTLGPPGMGVNLAALPLLLPDRRRWPKKQRRVYYGLPKRRPRHCGGHGSAPGAMGLSPDKRCLGVNDACRAGLGGCQSHMPVHGGVMGNQEGEQGAMAKGGGLQEGGGGWG
jgi:hypothetical protein